MVPFDDKYGLETLGRVLNTCPYLPEAHSRPVYKKYAFGVRFNLLVVASVQVFFVSSRSFFSGVSREGVFHASRFSCTAKVHAGSIFFLCQFFYWRRIIHLKGMLLVHPWHSLQPSSTDLEPPFPDILVRHCAGSCAVLRVVWRVVLQGNRV